MRNALGLSIDCNKWNIIGLVHIYVCLVLGAPERSHSILLQFSVTGGITWHLMDEFYFTQTTDILFVNVPLPTAAQTNATRFRLWQPYHNGIVTSLFVMLCHIVDIRNTMENYSNNKLNNISMLFSCYIDPAKDKNKGFLK